MTARPPGIRLREAHAHLPWLGRSLSMLDMASCTGLDACLQAVAARAAAEPRGTWIVGRSVRFEAWPEARWPTLRELDRAAPDNPVALLSFDHHALAANSLALHAAGIDRATPDPADGIIVRLDGQPTGVLLESAAKLVWSKAPEPDEGERERQLDAAIESLTALGFSEVHDLWSPPWLAGSLARRTDAGRDKLRVDLFAGPDDLDLMASTRPAWERPNLRLAGLKIFVDGTLNSRTAWMLRPYVDGMPESPHGTALMSVAQIEAAIRRAWSLGVGLAAHAIGDGAVRAVLDAVERAGKPDERRFVRIEHAEVIDKADIPRFERLGVIASLQPCHLLADIEALRRAIPDRLDRVLPIRSLLDAGLLPGRTLLFGSDVPVVRADPEDSVLAATLRRRADMPAGDAIAPGEAIYESDAWRAFERA
jgi:predicted amidohydrolase YtcJ